MSCCFRYFDRGYWQVTCGDMFRGFSRKNRRNLVLTLQRICLKPLTQPQISSKRSYIEMSHGSMAMTLKIPSLPIENHLSLHVRRHYKVSATSRSFWRLFSFEVLVIHHEYAPPGRTLSKEDCVEVVRRLRDVIRRKRPLFWASGDWHLHDNPPARSSLLMKAFLKPYIIRVF
jgi:hypothetical protein